MNCVHGRPGGAFCPHCSEVMAMTIRQKDGNEQEVTHAEYWACRCGWVCRPNSPQCAKCGATKPAPPVATQPAAGECVDAGCDEQLNDANRWWQQKVTALERQLATVTAERDAARGRTAEQTAKLLEMGQACLYWASDTGECHFCSFDGDDPDTHDEDCPVGEYLALAAQPNTGERARRPAQWMIARAKEVMAKAESGETSLTIVELIALAIAHAVTGEPATPVTIRRPAREVGLKLARQLLHDAYENADPHSGRYDLLKTVSDSIDEAIEADRRGEP